MCISKKTYYYNPQIRKDDFGYSVDIYQCVRKKSTVIYTYTDSNYRKVLYFAQWYVFILSKCQKKTDKLTLV